MDSMYIDTHTKATMEQSLCKCFYYSPTELRTCVKHFAEYETSDYDGFLSDMDQFIHTKAALLPDEILFFHFSRRLKGTENDITGYNLVALLTTNNPLSEYLQNKGVVFKQNKGQGHIDTYYHGVLIDWDNCIRASTVNISYMKKRLGLFAGHEDYCFNGLAFHDLITKNDYAKYLYCSPEFLSNLATCLNNKSIISEYFQNSKYFCYEYKLPMNEIIFDSDSEYANDQKSYYFIRCVLLRLIEYYGTNSRYMFDDNNPILRLPDNVNMSPQYYLGREEITRDMIF